MAVIDAPSDLLHDPAAVRLQDVHLSLDTAAGPVDVLRGVTLHVAPGEAVGVVGPSGSGKSSMMMVMAGLESATSGLVQVAGTDLVRLSEDALARFRRDTLGIIFQRFHLIPTMSALENVAIPLELAGRRDAFALARDQLQAVGLGNRLHHYPGQLSGGEQQRVVIARAFVAAPRLLLADEPTGSLDGAMGARVIDLMFEMRRAHASSLVLITHDPAVAGRCDRVVEMRDGRIEPPQ
ncbi:MAG: ATP-binding cassette domain-containing protein [Alphaproteobacteria bacterium]|nr:ATP-binding cassette domain-containing protein [Alphaproteobacteria bacterium]